MKLLSLIAVSLLLTGCVTVPVEREFPKLPPSLQSGCPDLAVIPQNTTKLSEVLVVVTNNYSLYQECQIKVETWLSWYNEQKKIFDTVR